MYENTKINSQKQQKAHGPYRSPEKQFQSINIFTQGYDHTMREKKHYLLFENWMFLHLNKLETPSPGMLFVKFGWNEPSGSGKEDFLNPSMNFRHFFITPTPRKRRDPSLEHTKPESLSPKMLCAKYVWNLPNGTEEGDF